MHLSKVILTVAAVLLIVGMYFLPKVVVEDEEDAPTDPTQDLGNTELMEAHPSELSESEAKVIHDFKEGFKSQNNTEKSASFADSLAGLFASLKLLDSAAYYYERAADIDPGLDRWFKAGNGYFEAFTYAVELEKQRRLGELTREYYGKVLAEDPDQLEVKAKMAMTYLPQEPMQGVLMLREVIEKDPENALALYNLGLLSIQSRQFDKAVERFEKLVSTHPDHLEGQFYLGVAYFEAGNRNKALVQLEKVKSLDPDQQVQAAVDEYLKELK